MAKQSKSIKHYTLKLIGQETVFKIYHSRHFPCILLFKKAFFGVLFNSLPFVFPSPDYMLQTSCLTQSLLNKRLILLRLLASWVVNLPWSSSKMALPFYLSSCWSVLRSGTGCPVETLQFSPLLPPCHGSFSLIALSTLTSRQQYKGKLWNSSGHCEFLVFSLSHYSSSAVYPYLFQQHVAC